MFSLARMICFVLLIYSLNSFAKSILVTGNAFKEPKIWVDESQAKGILVDIMRQAGAKIEVKFEFSLTSWARAFEAATKENIGIVGISITEERLKIFDYSVPIYYDEVILVVKRGHNFPYTKHEDLTGKLIGACKGCSFGRDFEKISRNFKIYSDNNNAHRLRLLKSGRIDAGIFSPGVRSLKLALEGANDPSLTSDQFTVLKKPLTRDSNHLAFSKAQNKREFLAEFNKAIEELYQSGAIKQIIDRY
jgi:polar amino acid transport system substrate-binding protein